MSPLSDFQKECVRIALVKMFKVDGFFSICTVDSCLRVTGAVPPRAEYDALHALHCVNFRDMTPAMRQEVAQRTCALFDAPGFDLPQLHQSFLPPTPETEAKRESLTIWERARGLLS